MTSTNKLQHYYSIHEAKSNLSKLIQLALSGKEIIIAKHTIPLVKLTTIKKQKRLFERYKGKGKIAENFNDPLEEFKEY